MDITKVAELEAVERFDCEWKGEAFWFEAKKTTLTPFFLKHVETTVDYPAALADILTDWNITDGDTEKWGIDADSLARLPVEFLGYLLSKIGESWSGDKKKPVASASGSAAAAS